MNNLKQNNPNRYEQFIELVCRVVGVKPEEAREAKNLRTDLIFDSIDEIELLMECERAFDISVSDDEVEDLMGDVDAICNSLHEKINEAHNPPALKTEEDASKLGSCSVNWVEITTPPTVDYFYLVYDKTYGTISKALYDGEFHLVEGLEDTEITHWAHLPKPPFFLNK